MREISFRNDILPLKDKLYRLALRITFDSAEAEDIVQDTMIRVWNKRDEWTQFDSIEAYCLTVARNLAIDRSQKLESQNVELTPETQDMPDALTPDRAYEQDEQLRLVHHLINELPEKQRTIVQLRDIEGKSYKEIADVLFLLIHSVAKINNIVYITNTSAKYLACMLQSQNFLSVNFVACLFCHSFYMIAYEDDDVEVVNSRRFVL